MQIQNKTQTVKRFNIFGLFFYQGNIYRTIKATNGCFSGIGKKPNNLGLGIYCSFQNNSEFCKSECKVPDVCYRKIHISDILSILIGILIGYILGKLI